MSSSPSSDLLSVLRKSQDTAALLDGAKPLNRSTHQIMHSLARLSEKARPKVKTNTLNSSDAKFAGMDLRYKKLKSTHESLASKRQTVLSLEDDTDIDNYLASTHEQIVISSISESKRSAEYESYSSHRRWMKDIWKKASAGGHLTTGPPVGASSASLSDLDVRVKKIIVHMFEDVFNPSSTSTTLMSNQIRPAIEFSLAYEEEPERVSKQGGGNGSRNIFLPGDDDFSADHQELLKDMFSLIKSVAKEGSSQHKQPGYFYKFAAENLTLNKASHSSRSSYMNNPVFTVGTGARDEVVLGLLEHVAAKFAQSQDPMFLSQLSRSDSVSGDGRVLMKLNQNIGVVKLNPSYTKVEGLHVTEEGKKSLKWALIFYLLRANFLEEAVAEIRGIREAVSKENNHSNFAQLGSYHALAEVINHFKGLQYQTSNKNIQSMGFSPVLSPADFFKYQKECLTRLLDLEMTHNAQHHRCSPFEWMCYNLACLKDSKCYFSESNDIAYYFEGLEDRVYNISVSDKSISGSQLKNINVIDYGQSDYQWLKLWFQYHLREVYRNIAAHAHASFDWFHERYKEADDCNLLIEYKAEFERALHDPDTQEYSDVEKAYIYMICQDFNEAISAVAYSFPSIAIILQNLCLYYGLIVPGNSIKSWQSQKDEEKNNVPIFQMLERFIRTKTDAEQNFCLEVCSYSLGLLDYEDHVSGKNVHQTYDIWRSDAENEYCHTGKYLLKKFLQFHRNLRAPDMEDQKDFYDKDKFFAEHKQLLRACFKASKSSDRYNKYLLDELSRTADGLNPCLIDRMFFLQLSEDATPKEWLHRTMFKTVCDALAKRAISLSDIDEESDVFQRGGSQRKIQFDHTEEKLAVVWYQGLSTAAKNAVGGSWDIKFQILLEFVNFFTLEMVPINLETYKSALKTALSTDEGILLMRGNKTTVFGYFIEKFNLQEQEDREQFKMIIFCAFRRVFTLLQKVKDGLYNRLSHADKSEFELFANSMADRFKQEEINAVFSSLSIREKVESLKNRIGDFSWV